MYCILYCILFCTVHTVLHSMCIYAYTHFMLCLNNYVQLYSHTPMITHAYILYYNYLHGVQTL